MDIIDIKDLEKWREQHPKEKYVRVRYVTGGIADLIFNSKPPSEVTTSDCMGAYTGNGDFIFHDREGTKHICYKNRSLYNNKR